jgi:DNA gyrase subunit A
MEIGKVQPTEITEEMEKSYLDYAMSVIVARALPDVRDGLKPVHRRLLFSMYKMGLFSTASYNKSAKIVGECMGKYHPHGDLPIYDALVRMAQGFSMRYPLIDGQGNFGSQDGDPPAAMRYTEAKLAQVSAELLTDIEKDTVDYIDNFDATLKDPLYLPARIPNLLLMGSEGIAVGMATKIPPHNLAEVVDAAVFMIEKGKVEEIKNEKLKMKNGGKEGGLEIKRIELDKTSALLPDIPDLACRQAGFPDLPDTFPNFTSEATIEDLFGFIRGPDFPTGGEIYDAREILAAYQTGRGKILIRAKTNIEETRNGKFQILISEIPYQVNKANLVAKIAELAKDKKIQGISDLRDESDRRGIRVVVELQKTARPKAVLNNLYQKTDLQTVFPANFVALVEGTPQTLNLKQILTCFVQHRLVVVTRRSIFELKEAKARAHILEGLKIALDNLDEVIATIKKSPTAEVARERLMEKFQLTEIQANAILDMQLRRLAALERQKIEDEYKMIEETINYLTDLLSHPEKILTVIKEELLKVKEKYGDSRRTRIFKQGVGEFAEEDLIPAESILVTVTAAGYIKRLPRGTFRSQRRGGKGVSGMTTKEEDEVAHLLAANTHDHILFFTNFGRVFKLRVWELPEGSRQAKGQAIVNLINLNPEEKPQTILTLPNSQDTKYQIQNTKYLLMVTKKGTVKKTEVSAFANIRSSGLIAIKLDKDDELRWVKPTSGDSQILLVSHEGKSIRFSEKGVRPTGRDTQGVRGIRLLKDDFVVGMEILPAKIEPPLDKRKKFFLDLLVVTENGIGKRTPLGAFRAQSRGGQGIKVANINSKTGKLVCCQLVDQEIEQVILTSKSAQVIKVPLKNIPRLGRATQGVILMRLAKDSNDSLAAATCLRKETGD